MLTFWFCIKNPCRLIFGLCKYLDTSSERAGEDGLVFDGDAGGVGDSSSASGFCIVRGGRFSRDGNNLGGPELSDGVGGSPLLHAIEQNIAPRLGKNGRPSNEQWHVLHEKQLSVACQC